MKKLILSLLMISGFANAATGIGTTEPYNTIKISSGVDGEVLFYTKEIGEELSSKEILVKLDDEIKLIERDVAKVNLKQSIIDENHYKKKVIRYKDLVEQQNLSESDYDDINYQALTATNDIKLKELTLKNKEKDLSDTNIFGLDNYIVSKRNIEVGDYVQSSTVLYEAVDVTYLKVRMLIEEKLRSSLEIGQEVEVFLSEKNDESIVGIVTQIGLTMEDGTYAYPVLIKIDNENKDISISKTVFVNF